MRSFLLWSGPGRAASLLYIISSRLILKYLSKLDWGFKTNFTIFVFVIRTRNTGDRGNFVLLSKISKSGKFLSSGKRHRIRLAVICIRLVRLHIGKESNYVHILLKVSRAWYLIWFRRGPLPFYVYGRSGNLAEQQQQSMEVKQEYLAPEAEILFINMESVVLNTSDIANGFDEDGIIDDLSDQLWWN